MNRHTRASINLALKQLLSSDMQIKIKTKTIRMHLFHKGCHDIGAINNIALKIIIGVRKGHDGEINTRNSSAIRNYLMRSSTLVPSRKTIRVIFSSRLSKPTPRATRPS